MAQSSLCLHGFLGKEQEDVECCNVLHVGKHPDVHEGQFFFCLTALALEPTVKQKVLLAADTGTVAMG